MNRDTKPITNLDQLIRKAMGMTDRPDTITISTGDIKLELTNLTDDEVIEYVDELTTIAQSGETGLAVELKKAKELVYMHCPLLQEYASKVPSETRVEPWDVFEELFDAPERNELRVDLYNQSGIMELLNGKKIAKDLGSKEKEEETKKNE